jgi:hypothetical protein
VQLPLPPFSSSPSLLHPFFFLTNRGSDMAPAPSCLPSPHLPSPPPPPDCGGSKMGYPKGRPCRGGSGFWGQNPQRRRGTGRTGWGRLLVGRLLGFLGSRAGGEDAVQGRVEAIRRRQHCRAVAMGAGAACVAPCPAPPRCVTGKTAERKG